MTRVNGQRAKYRPEAPATEKFDNAKRRPSNWTRPQKPGTHYSEAGLRDQASSGAPGQSPGGDCGGPRHGGGLKNVSQNLRTSNGNRVTGPGLTSRGHPIRISAPKIKLALAPRDSLPVATAAGLVERAASSYGKGIPEPGPPGWLGNKLHDADCGAAPSLE